jgi:hypothetical protein
MNLPILSNSRLNHINSKMIPKIWIVQRQDFLTADFVKEFHSNLAPGDSVLEIELINPKQEGYQNIDPETLVHLSIVLDSVFWESYLSGVLPRGTIEGLKFLLNKARSHISKKKYKYFQSNGLHESKINYKLKIKPNKELTAEFTVSNDSEFSMEQLKEVFEHVESLVNQGVKGKVKKTNKGGRGKSKK